MLKFSSRKALERRSKESFAMLLSLSTVADSTEKLVKILREQIKKHCIRDNLKNKNFMFSQELWGLKSPILVSPETRIFKSNEYDIIIHFYLMPSLIV